MLPYQVLQHQTKHTEKKRSSIGHVAHYSLLFTTGTMKLCPLLSPQQLLYKTRPRAAKALKQIEKIFCFIIGRARTENLGSVSRSYR